MTTKLRVSAATLPELRDFLAGSDVDMGCRPVARRHGDGFATEVMAEEREMDALSARRIGTVRIETLERMPDKSVRARLAPAGNRFLSGERPRGLGIKE